MDSIQPLKKAIFTNKKYLLPTKENPVVQEKMLAAIRGKPLSEEHKKKISNGGKGLKRSAETKEKIRIANLGKKLSEEHRQKISNTRKLKNREISI